jgi:hypothetical protein
VLQPISHQGHSNGVGRCLFANSREIIPDLRSSCNSRALNISYDTSIDRDKTSVLPTERKSSSAALAFNYKFTTIYAAAHESITAYNLKEFMNIEIKLKLLSLPVCGRPTTIYSLRSNHHFSRPKLSNAIVRSRSLISSRVCRPQIAI